MSPVEEAAVREQLQRAVAVLDPPLPPLPVVLDRIGRRRRARRLRSGGAVVVLAAAVVAIVLVVVAAHPGGDATVSTAASSRASLVQYAKAHGAHRVGGPFAAAATSYGAFSTGKGLVVVAYSHGRWRPDGPAVTSIEPAAPVLRIAAGPQLEAATPTIWVTMEGGDVSYFGIVLHRLTDRWRPALFGRCGHHDLCPSLTNEQPYGHPAGGGSGFTSVINNCRPYCAAGTQYRIRWRWDVARGRFVAVTVQPVHP